MEIWPGIQALCEAVEVGDMRHGINWCDVCGKTVDTLQGHFEPATKAMTYTATCHGQSVMIVQRIEDLDDPNRATRRPVFAVLL